MSVLIRGMEMPKSCNACMFEVYGLCLINKNIDGKDELTHSCPLVPVPPHGDLIDYDFCMENYELLHDDDGNPVYAVRMRDINISPTIIPAEDGE